MIGREVSRNLLQMTGFFLVFGLAACTAWGGDRPNVSLLKSGEFVFEDVKDGASLGRSRIVVARRTDDGYLFSNNVIGHAAQSWTCMAKADFTPLSAKLEMLGGGGTRQPIFTIDYEGHRVRGSRYPRLPVGSAPIGVDDVVDLGTIDQRIDWASVMARKLKVGSTFNFQVYDPVIGTSTATAIVGEGGKIDVPAGRFDTFKITYQIAKKTGAERFIVFASKTTPRLLVREDFQDGVSSQLEKAP